MGVVRRAYRSGNSVVVSLPLWMLEDIGVKVGEHVEMVIYPAERMIVVRAFSGDSGVRSDEPCKGEGDDKT